GTKALIEALPSDHPVWLGPCVEECLTIHLREVVQQMRSPIVVHATSNDPRLRPCLAVCLAVGLGEVASRYVGELTEHRNSVQIVVTSGEYLLSLRAREQ